MNRALSLFVLFCLLLVCIAGVIAWWLGPQLVRLAFDSQRAGAPFYSLYLQHQSGSIDGASAPDNGYNVRLLQLLAHPLEQAAEAGEAPVVEERSGVQAALAPAPQAEVLWQTSALSVLTGTVADEWSNLVVARFDSGRQFVRLVTSPQYRQVRDLAPQGRRIVVGSTTAPLRPLQHPAALLLLVEGGAQEALDGWVDDVVALGGEVIWVAPVAVLEAADERTAGWDALVLVGFADSEALAAWSFSVEAQTTNALLGAKTQALNLWLLQNLR